MRTWLITSVPSKSSRMAYFCTRWKWSWHCLLISYMCVKGTQVMGQKVKRSKGLKVQRSKYSLRVKVNGQSSHYSRKCIGVNREALQLHTVCIWEMFPGLPPLFLHMFKVIDGRLGNVTKQYQPLYESGSPGWYWIFQLWYLCIPVMDLIQFLERSLLVLFCKCTRQKYQLYN